EFVEWVDALRADRAQVGCGVPIRGDARDLALRLPSRLICTIDLNAFMDDGLELERVHLRSAAVRQTLGNAKVTGLTAYWHPTRHPPRPPRRRHRPPLLRLGHR